MTPDAHLTPDDRQSHDRQRHDRPPGHGGGPLRAVLDSLGAGAADLGEVAARTGLDRGVVSAAVAHLVRTGYLRTEQLTAGCPSSGCGSCGNNAGDGCPAGPAGITGRGPVLITLARPGTAGASRG